ncbi:hypothetical protein SODG_003301 [Sodalis praecaptivus]
MAEVIRPYRRRDKIRLRYFIHDQRAVFRRRKRGGHRDELTLIPFFDKLDIVAFVLIYLCIQSVIVLHKRNVIPPS